MSKQDLNPIVPCALRKLRFAKLSSVAQTKLPLVSKKDRNSTVRLNTLNQLRSHTTLFPLANHLRTLMTIYIKNKKQNPENFTEKGTVRVHTLVTRSLRKPDANVLPNSVVEEAPKGLSN